jgi:hypothetical protein
MPRRHAGRIRPHERDTNDEAAILGADVDILEQHSSAVRQTEQNDLVRDVKRDYRNRLKHIYEFWKEKYPGYYAVGIRELTNEDLADEDMYWHKNKHDLVYQGMNVKMVKAFLADKKKKANGKISSVTHLRKYNDAILYGAKKAGQHLPRSYYEEMEKFFGAYKKEAASAKKEGKLDEQEADPISWALFVAMLEWSLVAEKNVYLWVFTLLQWHCMARSVNIGVLALHSFRVGEDNIIVEYDKQKADQTGEKLHEKHCYDNPLQPLVSLFLALGVWFCLEAPHFEETEMLFQNDGNEANAASQRYCTQLCELFTKYKDRLKQYIRVDHANTHGVRKGSATNASSGTTCPPPVSSVAARGEWSLGRILDLYWHFSEPGDAYLGRVLAGFDPNGEEFGTLPPHWKVNDPMSNERIKEGMNLMFATILQRWGDTAVDPTGTLLLCLASVVWNSDFLKKITAADSEHPFNTIPLLSNPELLKDLKELVTLKPEGHVQQATGIPPHVQNAKVAKEILNTCVETLNEVKEMATTVHEAVKQAFEEKAFENGQLTGERLQQMFNGHQERMVQMIDNKLSELRTEIQQHSVGMLTQQQNDDDDNNQIQFADGEEERNTQGQAEVRYRTYLHGGRHWYVPADFSFPTGVNLETGWKMWIQGLPGNETLDNNGNRLQAPIRPFRKLKNEMLPESVRKNLQTHWRPIFLMMEQAPGIEIRETSIDAEYIRTSYEAGREYLKTRVGYVFQNTKVKPMNWKISYWSKKVARSEILKHGTEQDKASLPEESYRNKPRKQHHRSRPEADRRRVRRRLNPPAGCDTVENTEGELPDIRPQLSEEARARLYEVDEDAAAEAAAAVREQQEAASRANRHGRPAGDGTTIHVGPHFPLQEPLQNPAHRRFSR